MLLTYKQHIGALLIILLYAGFRAREDEVTLLESMKQGFIFFVYIEAVYFVVINLIMKP